MDDETLAVQVIAAVFGIDGPHASFLISKASSLSGWEAGEQLAEALDWDDEMFHRLRVALVRQMTVAQLHDAIGDIGVQFQVPAKRSGS